MDESKDENLYDPAYLDLLQRAYNEACDRLGMTPDTPDAERNGLAKLVMTVVADGASTPRTAAARAIEILRAPTR